MIAITVGALIIIAKVHSDNPCIRYFLGTKCATKISFSKYKSLNICTLEEIYK